MEGEVTGRGGSWDKKRKNSHSPVWDVLYIDGIADRKRLERVLTMWTAGKKRSLPRKERFNLTRGDILLLNQDRTNELEDSIGAKKKKYLKEEMEFLILNREKKVVGRSVWNKKVRIVRKGELPIRKGRKKTFVGGKTTKSKKLQRSALW